MTNKKKRQISTRQSGPNTWMIVAIIAIFFAVGLIAKITFFSNKAPSGSTITYETITKGSESLDRQVQLISSNFRCACGGCGELPLIECECDMPRGAQEEKGFMRRMLKEGLSVEEIIDLVDQKYGHKAT